MDCKKCNGVLSEGAGFCGKCGQKVIAEINSIPEQEPKKKSIFSKIISTIGFIFAIYIGLKLIEFFINVAFPL